MATEFFLKLWDNHIIQLGVWQTVYMTFLTSLFAYVIGLPLGVVLWVTDKDGLHPNKGVNTVLGFIVNFFRSIPAVILMVAMIPAARLLLGTSTGNGAVIVTLIIAAAPYVARMVESSLKEVPAGVIEAAQAMGCTNLQIIWHVLLPEAKPSLISGSIISTVYLLLVSMVIALPIGIASAVYLNEYAKKSKFNMLLRSGIETLTGVPSIVFGLMGVTVLFPVTQVFGATTTSILLGGLTMAIILLPTIIRSTEEALLVVPQHLRDASLSVGANQSQTIFKIVLPCAVPGILTGVLLGIGRVIGESAALIYTMGTFINDSPTLLSQGTSLAVQIWSIMSGEQPNYELACAISIIILVFVLILNFAVKVISKRFSKAWY